MLCALICGEWLVSTARFPETDVYSRFFVLLASRSRAKPRAIPTHAPIRAPVAVSRLKTNAPLVANIAPQNAQMTTDTTMRSFMHVSLANRCGKRGLKVTHTSQEWTETPGGDVRIPVNERPESTGSPLLTKQTGPLISCQRTPYRSHCSSQSSGARSVTQATNLTLPHPSPAPLPFPSHAGSYVLRMA
jgi:hypothetical protein